MKSLIDLDPLNLDPTAKTQVAGLIQSMLEQGQLDTNEQLQTLQRIGQLYEIETQGRLHSIKDRKILLTEKSVSILSDLHNWLFIGLELGGQRAATIQTLLAIAKPTRLNPIDWLIKTLEKLFVWSNNRIDELLHLESNGITTIKQRSTKKAKRLGQTLSLYVPLTSLKTLKKLF